MREDSLAILNTVQIFKEELRFRNVSHCAVVASGRNVRLVQSGLATQGADTTVALEMTDCVYDGLIIPVFCIVRGVLVYIFNIKF